MYRHSFKLKLGVAALLFAFAPLSQADRRSQDRWGIAVNVPFSSDGIHIKDTSFNLIFQKVRLREGGKVSGFELSFGSPLTEFNPTAYVAGVLGPRCAYGVAGVGLRTTPGLRQSICADRLCRSVRSMPAVWGRPALV